MIILRLFRPCLFGRGFGIDFEEGLFLAGACLAGREHYLLDRHEHAHEFAAVAGERVQPSYKLRHPAFRQLRDLLQTVPVPEAVDFLRSSSPYPRVLLQLELLKNFVDFCLRYICLFFAFLGRLGGGF